MLKIQEIRELIKLIDCSSIDEFTYEYESSKIKLKKQSKETETVVRSVAASEAPVVEPVVQPQMGQPNQGTAETQAAKPEPSPVKEDENLHKITSPMVGTFYSSSSPEADPYVSAGTIVKEDSVVCIVEAMKLFNEIEAEVKGEIVEILVENGQLVEYGQPLFLVKED
ncbi:acetyl-CoA carboxylase biotin carboxyl carrier protein [Metabacillus arenae]|uniref:Biotin carboxyl carrier protein of acetyl-CoA carboxylase n=1 Tax=Metabacillus arenae TaxID=2771434 RepID=A0A926RW41_9BACI|nr:acetyl-CoA carboxylase biotin carboxyl carrier protein [Metabacillus arenae]MBD1378797.1 acetyl-CoA carboxylase biotin carboxyl carrier protein [Metabacillus arenae]